MPALDRVTWRGRTFNRRTVQMAREVERRLDRPIGSVFQGSYSDAVGASAGTHSGGGAIDCWPGQVTVSELDLEEGFIGVRGDVDAQSVEDARELVLAMRRCGFEPTWVRSPSQGPWGWHVHGIATADPDLSPAAGRQVTAVLSGRNGLANNGPDDGPRIGHRAIWRYVEEESRTVVFGIDVSHHQGAFDFKRAYVDGARYAYLKCTEGEGWRDQRYPRNRVLARQAGLYVAAYHFLRSDSSAEAQAANVAGHIGNRAIPVIIDCEPGTSGSRPSLALARAFAAACQERGLRVSLLYLPRWYWTQLGEPSLRGFLPTIQSAYGPNPAGDFDSVYRHVDAADRWAPYGAVTPTILQYGDRGVVGGQSPVDLNAYRGRVADLSRWFLAPAHITPEDDIVTPEDRRAIIDGVAEKLRPELTTLAANVAAAKSSADAAPGRVVAEQIDMEAGAGTRNVSVAATLRYLHNGLARVEKKLGGGNNSGKA